MNAKIRVLVIAPYEEMLHYIERVSASFEQIELTVHIGDLDVGASIAQKNYYDEYDVVLSRGGTAQMIRQLIPLPVVEIGISMYDILCAIRLSQNVEKERIAIIGFSNITQNAYLLNEILGYNLDIFSVSRSQMIKPILAQVAKNGYKTVLCDMVAYSAAKEQDMKTFLITSGTESIKQAFEQVLFIQQYQATLRAENQFLRHALKQQNTEMVVFNTRQDLHFTTLDDESEEEQAYIYKTLLAEIPSIKENFRRRVIRNKRGKVYTINAEKYSADRSDYYSFVFSRRTMPYSSTHFGIHFYSPEEINTSYYNGFFNLTNTAKSIITSFQSMRETNVPLIISGEDGSGKDQAMSHLYLRFFSDNGPLITIDCALVSPKTWNYLLQSVSSPLYDTESMVYIKNIEKLDAEKQDELLTHLSNIRTTQLGRFVICCVTTNENALPQVIQPFVTQLKCNTIRLPSIREQAASLPAYIHLYLNQINPSLNKQIVGVEPDGMKLLQAFSWPQNILQLKRVISDLASSSVSSYISCGEVRAALAKEAYAVSLANQSEVHTYPLDLTQPLNEINREIVKRVLQDESGNQTSTAKRLGISRTTLWRMLGSKNEVDSAVQG